MEMRVLTVCLCLVVGMKAGRTQTTTDPYVSLLQKAQAQGNAHGMKHAPTLSPSDAELLDATVHRIDVGALHAAGFKVVPWTTNDPARMHALIALGVDGIISDYPNLLQQVVAEERARHNQLAGFDVSAHRGGRGLRPENTLPSFESGMDQGATTLETDTGVTTDGQSLIWHDQFLNPESCRRQDGAPYTLENRVYTQDISMREAQKTFICDKVRFGKDQKNDLTLSPVAVAFAKKEGLVSPYVPTNVEQLFRFTRFYAAYYKTAAGKGSPQAKQRAHTGETVRFNLETKSFPDRLRAGLAGVKDNLNVPPGFFETHSVGPQRFVEVLCGAIVRNGMVERSEVQSFDFRTLLLTQAQYPQIPTYYLTNNVSVLSSELSPEPLRLPAEATK